jgi:hypothetical protein
MIGDLNMENQEFAGILSASIKTARAKPAFLTKILLRRRKRMHLLRFTPSDSSTY